MSFSLRFQYSIATAMLHLIVFNLILWKYSHEHLFKVYNVCVCDPKRVKLNYIAIHNNIVKLFEHGFSRDYFVSSVNYIQTFNLLKWLHFIRDGKNEKHKYFFWVKFKLNACSIHKKLKFLNIQESEFWIRVKWIGFLRCFSLAA